LNSGLEKNSNKSFFNKLSILVHFQPIAGK